MTDTKLLKQARDDRPTSDQHAKLRKVLQHHKLTVHGDGVVEADIIAALEPAEVAALSAPAGLREALAAERQRIAAMLTGIDKTETESDDGWWETSTGAAFGAGILAKVLAGTPSPAAEAVATVGDLIIQVRERVVAKGIKNNAPLYAGHAAMKEKDNGIRS